MKILVLGATGFIGRFLAPRLKEATYFVRHTSSTDHLKGSQLIYGDITNPQEVLKASRGMDLIINLTAPQSNSDELNRKVIVGGTRSVLDAMSQNHITRLIHLSSVAGYRKNRDAYGHAKREADQLIKAAHIANHISATLLKPTLVYGPGGYLSDKLIHSATRFPFIVPVIGDGQNHIQPIYVEDLVGAILAAIEKLSSSNSSTPSNSSRQIEIYDLGGPHPIKFNDFIRLILKLTGQKKHLLHIPIWLITALLRPLNLIFRNLVKPASILRMVEEVELDVEATQKALGINLISYEEGLKKTLK